MVFQRKLGNDSEPSSLSVLVKPYVMLEQPLRLSK